MFFSCRFTSPITKYYLTISSNDWYTTKLIEATCGTGKSTKSRNLIHPRVIDISYLVLFNDFDSFLANTNCIIDSYALLADDVNRQVIFLEKSTSGIMEWPVENSTSCICVFIQSLGWIYRLIWIKVL